MARLLEGKVAIVTGADRPKGMGWAAALKMAEQAASVVVTDKCRARPELELAELGISQSEGMPALERLVGEIEALGGKGLAMAVDITVADEIKKCVEKTSEIFGGVDILFNNAGVAIGSGPFLNLSDEQWNLSWQVNVKGMADFIKEVIPSMKERGGGAIINNSSIAGQEAVGGYAAYTTTKHAVIGLTKAVAAEFGPDNIRCNAICPGTIMTDLFDAELRFVSQTHGISEEEAHGLLCSNIALGRPGEPGEAGDVVAYLAGPTASFLTGI